MTSRQWQNLLDSLLLRARTDGTLNEIENVFTENDLILFFMTRPYKDELLDWISNAYTLSPWKKCQQKAKLLREEGNKMFKVKNYEKCLEFYNESIKYAPILTEELPYAYANCSAALFHMENYEETLNNIDLALEYGYPKNLLYKLHLRKGECLAQLGRHQEAVAEFLLAQDNVKAEKDITMQKKAQISGSIEKALNLSVTSLDVKESMKKSAVLDLPVPYQGMNEEFASASKAVTLQENEEKGRYVIAATDITIGDILFVEKPFAFVLLPEHYGHRCHHCCNLFKTLIPCEECIYASFCSKKCRKYSWNEYHKWECFGGLNIAHSVGIAHLGLRVVLKAGSLTRHRLLRIQLENNKPKGNEHYFAVYDLLTHLKDMSAEDRIAYSLTAVCLMLYLVHYTEYFTENSIDASDLKPDYVLIGSLILHHICQLVCNGHAITALQEEKKHVSNDIQVFDEKQVRIATAIFPSASMMNHSCDPNIINSFQGANLIVKAYKNLKKGEEVFNCYGPNFRRMSQKDRKESLRAQYHFECKCEACSSDNEYLDRFTALLCTKCHGPLHERIMKKGKTKCPNCGTFLVSSDILGSYTSAQDIYFKGFDLLKRDCVKEALEYLHQSHIILQKCLYKSHVLQRSCLDNIAKCYAMLGDYSSSVLFLKKTLPSIEEQFGVWSIEMAHEMQKITDLMICDLNSENYDKKSFKEKHAETLKYVQKAKEIFNLHYGIWNPSLIDILHKERNLKAMLV